MRYRRVIFAKFSLPGFAGKTTPITLSYSLYLCGGGIGRRKYKFVRIHQLTVGGHARVETTCRKRGTTWRG